MISKDFSSLIVAVTQVIILYFLREQIEKTGNIKQGTGNVYNIFTS